MFISSIEVMGYFMMVMIKVRMNIIIRIGIDSGNRM